MKRFYSIIVGLIILQASACDFSIPTSNEGLVDTLSRTDTFLAKAKVPIMDRGLIPTDSSNATDQTRNLDTTALQPSPTIETGKTQPEQVMTFAESLIGVPYVYASTDPKVGFDCSGFITYVFNHFKIRVPRSSIDFTNVGKTIPVEQAKRGDIVLFTGTNPEERHVGHMGLIVSNSDTLRFIHSTSGKAMGVTVSPLSKYYMTRFVKVIRIFPQNGT